MHWHIDRLTVMADAMEAFVTFDKDECDIATISEDCSCVPMFKGFGSSDCKCGTHLFSVTEETKKEMLMRTGMLPFIV
jgi:endonuclease-3